MLLEYDRGVNGEPVAEQNQQCVQPALEMVDTNNPEHDVDDGSNDAYEGTRDGLKPGMKGLCGKSEGVHVRNVIRDDPESKNDEAELTETTSWFQRRAKESTDRVLRVAFCESRC